MSICPNKYSPGLGARPSVTKLFAGTDWYDIRISYKNGKNLT
jgi:hypothetical protein